MAWARRAALPPLGRSFRRIMDFMSIPRFETLLVVAGIYKLEMMIEIEVSAKRRNSGVRTCPSP